MDFKFRGAFKNYKIKTPGMDQVYDFSIVQMCSFTPNTKQ